MWRSGMTSKCVSAFGLMSRIATNPSAARTWSPVRASSQKRQSSGSEDPLLRRFAGAGPDELADLAAHEPGRIVAAVAAARAVDQHDVLAADLRAPEPQARLERQLAQPCAAGPLQLRRNGVRCSGLRARPRRVREDVDARDARPSNHVERALERRLVLAGETDDHVARQ